MSIVFTGNENNIVVDYYVERFLEFLSPDSAPYSSTMNPIFSFELKLRQLPGTNFSLRDGVFSLMRFFALNKTPEATTPIFIIDSRLSALVPESWRGKVLLRSPYAIQIAEAQNNNKIFLFISADKKSLPFDLLESEMKRIESSLYEKDELVIHFSSLRMRGEGVAFSDQAYGYKVLMRLMTFFKGRKITVINYAQFLKTDLMGSKFHFLNPLLFHFSDSSLFHEAATKGSKPLINYFNQNSDKDKAYALSENHGFTIHQNFAPYIGYEYDEVQRTLFHSLSVNIHERIYQKSFVDWSYDVARSLYNSSAKNVR